MKKNDSASFRDPSGHVFIKKGRIFRQVNKIYFPQFNKLINSGLYKHLLKEHLIVKHKIISKSDDKIVIEHKKVPFITYPYEWSFTMLKDAALLTLKIQKTALNNGMILKDASTYNIQFIGSSPIFIDTLSFDIYKEGETWIAYKQFCQHFLAPLALMSKVDLRMNLLLRDFIDGIPLDLASSILPITSKFNLSLLSHIHLHAGNQKRMANKKINTKKFKMSKFQMLSLIASLEKTISNLKLPPKNTQWAKYYTFTNYTKKSFIEKHKIVENMLKKTGAKTVLDLGANNGEFSEISVNMGTYTIASDIDPIAIETCYLKGKKNNQKKLLPIITDLTNPSPAIGWANAERDSFADRFQVDCVMALALIHHLAISNNLPFDMIANNFSYLGKYLIIEFVPKEDSKVQILLQNREDIFDNYSQKDFEKVFSKYYKVINKNKLPESKRIIYLMQRK